MIASILFAMSAICVVVAISVLFTRHRRRNPVADRHRFVEALTTPDWDYVGATLGDVPPELRDLYSSRDVLRQYMYLEVEGEAEGEENYDIAEFEPLRRGKPAWRELEVGCLSFADDGFGNEYFLRVNTGPAWPVFFYDHEGGLMEPVSDSLAEFLRRCRGGKPI